MSRFFVPRASIALINPISLSVTLRFGMQLCLYLFQGVIQLLIPLAHGIVSSQNAVGCTT
jgi:hypothetical protein